MGKKLDALLGRNFKTSKFKATANLAISRVAVLKNQRQARRSIARSDVVQLLTLGHHERALLRVEQVIKEQNMLDVFDMIEGYSSLVMERVNLLQQEKICPEELKEAISSLIYAATRCGEFPELQELRAIFTSRFGKEFTARAVELRNNCGVDPKMIQKLSTRMPSLEQRTKVLKEIAAENNIVLQIEETILENVEEKKVTVKRKDQPERGLSSKSVEYRYEGTIPGLPQDVDHEARGKYKDVADAAQAAFESAAYAAAAARAAVELSRSESRDKDDPKSPSQKPRNLSDSRDDLKSEFHAGEENNKRVNVGDGVEKIQPSQNYGFHSDGDEVEELKQRKFKEQFKRSVSASSSDSGDDILVDEIGPGHGIIFDEIDEEVGEESRIPSLKHPKNEVFGSEKSNSKDDTMEGDSRNYMYLTGKQLSPVHKARNEKEIEGFTKQGAENVDIYKKPISVRTRKNYHW
ncbi:uncharacterized protein LOC132041775 [Lycium ferocissimum]|uniref:uncharacterized protein LOC132041775 n=1 Tax=Lycium ferocissimum TaxID=112874 RepID=UPI0028156558|nr:uncharacterized protein LOC132041775 [Lycium ferocissimum]